jgi:DNA mismatch endonuclease (patch repair protein)
MAALTTSWASSDRARNVMRGNRSRNTMPELAVRSAVHRRGLRYRVSARPLPYLRRSADLVFTTAKVAVFIDGCYWHGCPQHYVPAKTNIAYWSEKIERNRSRDADTDSRLIAQGWLPLRIWAHVGPEQAAELVAQAVTERSRH